MAAAKTLAVILVISLTLAVRCTAGASVTRLADFPNFTEVPLIRQGTVYSCGIACLHSLLPTFQPPEVVNGRAMAQHRAQAEPYGEQEGSPAGDAETGTPDMAVKQP